MEESEAYGNRILLISCTCFLYMLRLLRKGDLLLCGNLFVCGEDAENLESYEPEHGR